MPKIKGASKRGERLEQIVAANIDKLIIISSTKKPKLNNRFIDRLIVTAESSHVETIIVINKIDLDKTKMYQETASLYQKIGYKVILTDALNEIGLDELKNIIQNSRSIFWGQSGVGKSTLINKLFPNSKLKTGEISDWSNKGKHTTVTSILLRVSDNTSIIDTPGIREIDPYGIQKEDLGHYFVEFKPFLDECKFNTCTHNHEPGCAIVKAVEKGKISEERFISYLNILDTIEDDMFY